MISVGVAELKAKLSHFLARVRNGSEVLVTDHGRPVARIVPVTDPEAEIDELERAGLIRRGTGELPKNFFDRPLPRISGPPLSQTIIEERREGR